MGKMDYFVFPTFFYYEKCIKTLPKITKNSPTSVSGGSSHKPATHELIPFTLKDGESVRNINS